MHIKAREIRRRLEEAVGRASFKLREDVLVLLRQAFRREKNPKARQALGWIIENSRLADRDSLAICQDTGFPVIFIEAGQDIDLSLSTIEAIQQGVSRGYLRHYLRRSIVEPLKRGKSSYRGAIVHIDFISGRRGLQIYIMPKGFGAENKTQLKMFNPTASIQDIECFVASAVKAAGPEACPPFVIGLGIGGSADHALLLAKKALLERIDSPHRDMSLRRLERNILRKINLLHIGPMGLGGKCTALAVKIKTAPTHIAGLPVGVNISCHALRSALIKF